MSHDKLELQIVVVVTQYLLVSSCAAASIQHQPGSYYTKITADIVGVVQQ